MAHPFLNRISGLPGSPDQTGIPSLWLVRKADHHLTINLVPAQQGDVLAATDAGRWSASAGHPPEDRWQGLVPTAERLPVHERLSLKELRARLEELGDTWEAWSNATPLVPGIDKKADLNSLDLDIRENIGAMSIVAHRPRMSLDVDIETVPVAVARKVPARAPSYLASHTEDWQRITLRGVIPKRVLSEVRRDDLAIYENRVTVTLIDHLTHYLNERLAELRRALHLLSRVYDYTVSSVTGTHERQYRVYSLWGESLDQAALGGSARETLRFLEQMRHEMLGLKDTLLYRELRSSAPVGTTLHATNLLTHDQYYRRVEELWRAWASRALAGDALSPQENYVEEQEIARSFEWFVMLLACRALGQLRLQPAGSAHILERDTHLELRSECAGLRIALRWTGQGTIDVMRDGQVTLRLVPVPQVVAAAQEHADARLEEIGRHMADADVPLLVLFPWTPEPEEAEDHRPALIDSRLQNAGNDPRLGCPAGLGAMPVSSWDIDSTERVARVLRWALWGPLVAGAAHAVRLPSGLSPTECSSEWLRPDGQDSLLVMRVPTEQEWKTCFVGGPLDDLTDRTAAHAAEVERLRDALAHCRNPQEGKSLSGEFNSERQRHERCAAKLSGLVAVREEVSNAVGQIEAAAVCPVCCTHIDTRSSFAVSSRQHYEAACHDCHSSWGTRVCAQCGSAYPYLIPGGDFTAGACESADCVDDVFGADVLAVPVRAPERDIKFVCPRCGTAN